MRDPEFDARNEEMVAKMAVAPEPLDVSQEWIRTTYPYEYSDHFEWMGMPVIQYPQDIVALQELLWTVRPDAVVETGIARGGSLVFYASMMQLMGGGKVIGVDIDIRAHNRAAIEAHPMAPHIELIEGSSVEQSTVDRVHAHLGEGDTVLVVLDSHHTHDHRFILFPYLQARDGSPPRWHISRDNPEHCLPLHNRDRRLDTP